jgi:hypothetical protein
VSSLCDWEWLRFDAVTTIIRKDGATSEIFSENKRETRTRLRVRANGRLGETFGWFKLSPDREQLIEAIEDSRHGPPLNFDIGRNYPLAIPSASESRDLSKEALRLPDVVSLITSRRFAKFRASEPKLLEWDYSESLIMRNVVKGHEQAFVVTNVDIEETVEAGRTDLLPATAPVAVATDTFQFPVVLGPLALAAIIGNSWTIGLQSGSHIDLPPGVSLTDDGSGPPTDLEGTLRRSTTFQTEEARTPIRTLTTAENPDELTGHGGFDGSEIDNLTITPTNFDGFPAEASHIIPNARRLAIAPDLFAMTAVGSDYRAASSFVVQVRDLSEGLQSGRWLPPVQRGSGPWKSPWLQLDEPNRVFRLLRVDATS